MACCLMCVSPRAKQVKDQAPVQPGRESAGLGRLRPYAAAAAAPCVLQCSAAALQPAPAQPPADSHMPASAPAAATPLPAVGSSASDPDL